MKPHVENSSIYCHQTVELSSWRRTMAASCLRRKKMHDCGNIRRLVRHIVLMPKVVSRRSIRLRSFQCCGEIFYLNARWICECVERSDALQLCDSDRPEQGRCVCC